MTEHKHAWLLRALADGVPLEEFEGQHNSWPQDEWRAVPLYGILTDPENWQIRRKQKMHVVNGFTVPAPETVAPAMDADYYLTEPTHPIWRCFYCWSGTSNDLCWLGRGLVHLNEAAAVANAKAMCGIDPNAKDES